MWSARISGGRWKSFLALWRLSSEAASGVVAVLVATAGLPDVGLFDGGVDLALVVGRLQVLDHRADVGDGLLAVPVVVAIGRPRAARALLSVAMVGELSTVGGFDGMRYMLLPGRVERMPRRPAAWTSATNPRTNTAATRPPRSGTRCLISNSWIGLRFLRSRRDVATDPFIKPRRHHRIGELGMVEIFCKALGQMIRSKWGLQLVGARPRAPGPSAPSAAASSRASLRGTKTLPPATQGFRSATNWRALRFFCPTPGFSPSIPQASSSRVGQAGRRRVPGRRVRDDVEGTGLADKYEMGRDLTCS